MYLYVAIGASNQWERLKILAVGVVGRKFEGDAECDKRDSGSCVEVSVS